MLRKQSVMDKRSDGRMDNVKTVYPPTNTVCGGIIMRKQRTGQKIMP